MDFFHKLIRKEDFIYLFNALDQIKEDAIEVGNKIEFEPESVIKFMNLWSKRIDKVIEIDKRVNGHHTWITDKATNWRGFTYREFSALHNQYIPEESFSFYPVFNQLNKSNGGINTEKQRTDFTFHFQLNEEDYIKILRENGYEPLLEFFFGLRTFSVILPLKQMFAHTEIVAPSGYGKSELLRAMFYRMQKKYKKYSFVLIDPHGSLAQDIKRFNLNRNADRLLYINPTLKEGYTPTFNPFELGNHQSIKELTHTAEQIITAFEEILNGDTSGRPLSDVMINTLEKCIYFLLARPNSSFKDLLNLLNCEEYLLLEAEEFEPNFFNEWFTSQGNKTREALLHRLGRTMNSPILRYFLEDKSTFDLENALNSGKVIILDLGDIGQMSQEAIGKIFVASIKSIVRKRQKGNGLPTFLFIDEAHILMSGSFDYILSQLRGYGLHLVLSHQYLGQLGKQAESVLQNTAVKIVGGDDTDEMKRVTKIPKGIELKSYEFFLKVRHRDLIKFKSSDKLIKNSKKYELSRKEEKELDKIMLDRYYKVIGSTDNKKRKERPLKQAIKNPSLQEEKQISLIPPFRLLIDENDKAIK